MDYEILLKYGLPPFIGAIIGLFTNYMAIKMLFRPFKPIKIFGLIVPFTPGVIPRQHENLAVKIGQTVSNHLLTTNDLNEIFTSDKVKSKILDALEGMYAQFGMLASFITPEIKELIASKVLGMLQKELPAILDELDVHEIVTTKVREFSLEQLEKIILEVAHSQLFYITIFGGILGAVIGCINIFI